MKRFSTHFVGCLLAAILCAGLSLADDVPRILFLTQSKGFQHGSVNRKQGTRAPAELAMLQLAKDSGAFKITCTQNAEADITKENLQKFDLVAFYTSGNLPIADADLDYLLNDWLHQKGHGFIGFHSATDTYKNHEPYWDFVGGTFNGHPWGAGSKVTVKVHDTEHPAMMPFGDSFEIQDEIYQYNHWQPEKCHVLMSIDMAATQTKRPYHVPIAWCKQIGQGRMFCNNLGHREETWQDERFLKSVLAAVQWVSGQTNADAKPNPAVSAAHHAASIKAAHAAGITQERLQAEKKIKDAKRAAKNAADKAKAAAAGN
ncbi:ThuA domain-containing protein [Planctomycetes bacterium K23_9]